MVALRVDQRSCGSTTGRTDEAGVMRRIADAVEQLVVTGG